MGEHNYKVGKFHVITNLGKKYYKDWQILQSRVALLQGGEGITKWDKSYHKVEQVLQYGAVITKEFIKPS